jgi:CheY-like chemotaxis protein
VAKKKIDQRDKALLMIEKTEKALLLTVNLTNQLLTFSKGGKPVKKTINLGPVIEDATRFALSGSRSNCRFALDGDLWNVDADEGQIVQVIQNIVLNAVQAMPAGGIVTVTASNKDLHAAQLASVPGPGKWIGITIRDTGVGIPEKNLQHIFEPYFTTKMNGSGLGLASSYSIVKNHGGMIEVASAPDKGSVFTIWLPAGGSIQSAPAQTRGSGELRRGRILVMDDEDVVRESVGWMLDTLGQEVEFSSEGASAIEKYSAAQAAGTPFSAVILDATVRGGMGGEETMRTLREIDPAVVAVIASGYSEDAVVADYQAYGFKAFLPKPFTMDLLQAVLESVMK